jgi:hypothetical protein
MHVTPHTFLGSGLGGHASAVYLDAVAQHISLFDSASVGGHGPAVSPGTGLAVSLAARQVLYGEHRLPGELHARPTHAP